ncbi:hypothetical protein IAPFLPAM_00018 [Sulfurimonas phage SNW-1]|nr:hypothetical protein IAPFLPAM_00018 [Sulfurimonas phage SNW-1]
MFRVLLMVFVLLTFQACSECKPQVKYVDKPYEVKIPVKCVVPDANCSFDRNTSTEVISSLLECIIDMKRNEEVCK